MCVQILYIYLILFYISIFTSPPNVFEWYDTLTFHNVIYLRISNSLHNFNILYFIPPRFLLEISQNTQ